MPEPHTAKKNGSNKVPYALLGTCVVVLSQLLSVEELDNPLFFATCLIAIAIPLLILKAASEKGLESWVMLASYIIPVLAIAACFYHFSLLACMLFLGTTIFVMVKVE